MLLVKEKMAKKYPPGTKLRVLTSDHNTNGEYPYLTKGNIITIIDSVEYGRAYNFKEAKSDEGWLTTFIENPAIFEPLVCNWKEELSK